MSESISPIILVGPTTVGKTDIAKAIADTTEGHLINSDRHYFYVSENFSLGLGLEHGELNDGRQRHLYGGLNAHDAPPTPAEYEQLVVNEVNAIHDLGSIAVVEGCTRRYAMRLIDYYGTEHAVGITWIDRTGLDDMVRKRLTKLSRAGLYDETEQAISLGYGETFPMSTLMYRVAARVLRSELTVPDAEETIITEWVEIASTHDDIYASIPNLERFEHDRNQTIKTAANIVSTLQLKFKSEVSIT